MGAVDQCASDSDVSNAGNVVAAARDVLAHNSYFRGRADQFALTAEAGILMVDGVVPSFYLRQLLQATLRGVPGVRQVDNRVEVVCPEGLSSCSLQTRQQCDLAISESGQLPPCFPTCAWANRAQ